MKRKSRCKLAIVIPAYKHQFLDETLRSIKAQSCKDFNLYIGNDCSPGPVKEIVERYKWVLEFNYQEFESNLGGKSLVKQWERCLEMVQDEEWIWLFSDDDLMGPDCVRKIYETLDSSIHEGTKLLRFNKVVIDNSGKTVLEICNQKRISSFLELVYDALGLTVAAVSLPEFLFHKSLYNTYGFVKFPLAWGSDKATWLTYVSQTGFVSNLDEFVYFRHSGFNISSIQDPEFTKLKEVAKIKYNRWLFSFLLKNRMKFTGPNLNVLLEGYLNKQVFLLRRQKLSFNVKFQFFLSLVRFAKSRISYANLIKLLIR